MSWLLGVIIDNVPWWLWLTPLLVLLAATWQFWRPIVTLIPWPGIVALAAVIAGAFAYLAGRNKGAAGALQRAQEKEQARADDIREKGAAARARADRDAMDGRLFDDDGWRRPD